MSQSSTEQDDIWDRFDAFIAEKNLKQTKQRRVIVDLFLKHGGHVSAEDLHEFIRSQGHNIGLATIYRTLSLLKEGGFADQKNFTDGHSVYEINEPDSHHDHLVCVKCNKVVEFEDDIIEKQQKAIAAKHGFILQSHNLDLFGICASCRL